MIHIAIVIGSTRPGRRGEMVGRWAEAVSRLHPRVVSGQARISLLDLAHYDLPLLDEPLPPFLGGAAHEHTRRWAAAIAAADGFVFVTPEYNHSLPGALKNAIDFLFAEWNDKAASIVSYGVQGGIRAAEHLRAVLAEVKVASVRTQVALSLHDDFRIEDPSQPGVLAVRPHQEGALGESLSELLAWTAALRAERAA